MLLIIGVFGRRTDMRQALFVGFQRKGKVRHEIYVDDRKVGYFMPEYADSLGGSGPSARSPRQVPDIGVRSVAIEIPTVGGFMAPATARETPQLISEIGFGGGSGPPALTIGLACIIETC
jgi:hypothetical protein